MGAARSGPAKCIACKREVCESCQNGRSPVVYRGSGKDRMPFANWKAYAKIAEEYPGDPRILVLNTRLAASGVLERMLPQQKQYVLRSKGGGEEAILNPRDVDGNPLLFRTEGDAHTFQMKLAPEATIAPAR